MNLNARTREVWQRNDLVTSRAAPLRYCLVSTGWVLFS
jgi:hypothetical protein